MAAITPQYELGRDVQYFLTPLQQNSTTKAWEPVTDFVALPLQGRVEDVTITPTFQSQSISPTHVFNTNPVIFESGCNVEIKEARQATSNIGPGSANLGVLYGNVLETCYRNSYVVKLEIKRFNKSGTEIAANRITMILQFSQAPTTSQKNGTRAEASLSTIAVMDSTTGTELANPFFGATGVPF